jgi:hypothetical protein
MPPIAPKDAPRVDLQADLRQARWTERVADLLERCDVMRLDVLVEGGVGPSVTELLFPGPPVLGSERTKGSGLDIGESDQLHA